MKHLICLVCLLRLLGAGLSLPFSARAESVVPPETQRLVFYEIFTGSFSDSDGDGTGDLRGLLARLDYLNDGDPDSGKSLGVQGLWLTPVFPSPSYHKYDVTDYRNIDPAFGTLEDMKNLIDACHARGMRLILDLPLNHTSRSHPWFRRFQSARTLHNDQNEYYDWYICHSRDGLPAGHACYPIAGTEFCYEGNFSPDMPELNYDSEKVRQEALAIAKFWLDQGVDGFRFDAAKYIYFGDNARSAAFWEWFCRELRALSPDIWLVAEVWDSDAVTHQYYPAVNCFDFTLSQASGLIAEAAAGGDVNRYAAYVETYLNTVSGLREGATIVPFLSNHDMDRAAGYLPDSNGRIRVAANLYLLGPGAPFLYYGEEIGLRGSRGGANTDANRRLAMRWGDGDPVQDPPGADYAKQTDATVASMTEQNYSLLNYYRRVIALRRANPEIAAGECRALRLSGTKAGGFVFTGPDSSCAVLHNTTQKTQVLDLAEIPDLAGFSVLHAQVGLGAASLEGTLLTLEGQTSVILR